MECPGELPLKAPSAEFSSESWPVYECVAACPAEYGIIDRKTGLCVDTCPSLLYDARVEPPECLPRQYACPKAVRVGNQRKCVSECPAELPWLGTDRICAGGCAVY